MNNEKDKINEYMQNNAKEDFLALMDIVIKENPLLMQLAFSSWKLRALNLIDDYELEKIHKGLEKNREQLIHDYNKAMKEQHNTISDVEEAKNMDKLIQIFETYKTSEYYNNSSIEINFDWLKDKLGADDLEELEKQIYGIVLENEEEVFINCFRYAFELFQEIAVKEIELINTFDKSLV